MTRLYVGADESNHGGKKGEIVVAVFSTNNEDSIVGEFKNGRKYTILENWLKLEGRDYRFTILFGDGRNGYSNLPRVVPTLISAYLLANPSLEVNSLGIYLDGIIYKGDKEKLQSSIPGIDKSRVTVNSFTKKGSIQLRGRIRVIKRPICPRVVNMADILANHLFTTRTLEELSQDKRMVVMK